MAKYQPNDPLNPYDPASLELGSQGVFDRMSAGTSPAMSGKLAEKLKDPKHRAEFWQMMKNDAEERKRTGETMQQQALREKREWAAQDAKSASLKLEGNAAFSQGDYKRAFVIYSACARLSPQEPVYHLNRAATGLKLKAFKQAEDDAAHAILEYESAKAHFRRAQARRFLGNLEGADEDLRVARELQPGDPSVEAEVAELAKLKKISDKELEQWIGAQEAVAVNDIFGSIEVLEELVQKVLQAKK
ncbi:Outer envelope protein 64, chloroplastic [Hypsizygus marmoreus]|uniref:Outer envelope protein 64, chloroplastic n=1 Tax=Hypsizygus marmoreus TaxID=39966 RepID=A0A369JLL8_HYPMA|nr:Outer envelope protein 64, chloroplastic [Hypsizygus marmoreus]